MSQYGPPGGPYPGEPPKPWPAADPPAPYSTPADPWGTAAEESWGGAPMSTPPGAAGSPTGYGEASPGHHPVGTGQPGPGYPPGRPEHGHAGYGAAGYGPPEHGQAGYGQPEHGPAGYGQAEHGPAGYGQPEYRHPGYGQPEHGQAGYGAAGYGRPEHGQPGQAQPGYRPPGYPAQGAGGGYDATYGHTRSDAGPPADGAPGKASPWRRSPGWPLIALGVTLAVLVCGGLTAAYLWFGGGDDKPTAQSNGRGVPAGGLSAAPTAPSARETTPAPDSSTDARFVTVGQCVRNEGSDSQPRMTIVPCGARTYEVLTRFNGPTNGEADAKSKCSKVSGYTNWYFFNSDLDTLDFVLCLKLR